MNGTTRNASRSSKSRRAKSRYSDTREECTRHFGLLLTDKQIRKYSQSHPVLKRDVAEDIFETFHRDFFISYVVEDVLGKEYWWPVNGDQDAYKSFFYPVFYNAAMKKGIQITPEAERIAAMYDQIVVSVPEKIGKKITKAIKKKFDIHAIEGGITHSAEGVSVAILANGVNPTLLTVVQIWAEGFVEGAS